MNLLTDVGVREGRDKNDFKVSVWQHKDELSLTYTGFCCKVVSLLFNKLSRLVITFPSKEQCLLILRLQSPSALILEPKR